MTAFDEMNEQTAERVASPEREPIYIHPETRERLRSALMNDPALHQVGYTLFIENALDAHEKLAAEISE